PSRTLRLRASGVYTDQESDVTAPQGEDRIVSSDKNAASMEKGVSNCHTTEPPVHPSKGRAADSDRSVGKPKDKPMHSGIRLETARFAAHRWTSPQ
ncbi:hypothetical protein KXV92_007770, partial [Aspergillus fumigatus]